MNVTRKWLLILAVVLNGLLFLLAQKAVTSLQMSIDNM